MGQGVQIAVTAVQGQHRGTVPAGVVHPLQQLGPRLLRRDDQQRLPRPAATSRPSPTARCAGAPPGTRCRTSVGDNSGSPDQAASSSRCAARCQGSYAALPTSSSPPPCGTTAPRSAPANRRVA